MSKFFVGQRVRIVGCDTQANRPLIGRESTVLHVGSMFCTLEQKGAQGHGRWAHYNLAPAYDGNEVVSWESCKWQPNRDEVRA